MNKRCKVDLITGFLGSGKTTFLRHYAEFLLRQGEKVCILENDYGAINVDLVFLHDLLSQGCGLEMVIGGDGPEAHQRRFKTKLISMAMMGYTRILVEPSGIYDADEFFDTLREEPLDRWYEIGTVVGILDSTIASPQNSLCREGSKDSRYVLVSEMAPAGIFVLSHQNEAPQAAVLDCLMECFREFQCGRELLPEEIITKEWSTFQEEDFFRIEQAGYREVSHVKRQVGKESGFQSAFYFGVHDTEQGIRERLTKLFRDPDLGWISRVKGFVLVDKPSQKTEQEEHITTKESGFRPKTVWKSLEGLVDNRTFLEVNATRENIDFHRATPTREVLIVIGEHLQASALDRYFPEAAEHGII